MNFFFIELKILKFNIICVKLIKSSHVHHHFTYKRKENYYLLFNYLLFIIYLLFINKYSYYY